MTAHSQPTIPEDATVIVQIKRLQRSPALRESIEQCVRKVLRAVADAPFSTNIAATTASELAANVYDHADWDAEVKPSFAMWVSGEDQSQVLRMRFCNAAKDPDEAFYEVQSRISLTETTDMAEQKFRQAVVARALRAGESASAKLGLLMLEVGGHCKLGTRLDGDIIAIEATIALRASSAG